MLANSNFQE